MAIFDITTTEIGHRVNFDFTANCLTESVQASVFIPLLSDIDINNEESVEEYIRQQAKSIVSEFINDASDLDTISFSQYTGPDILQ